MAGKAKAFLTQMKDAKASTGGNYLVDGQGRLMVTSLKYDPGTNSGRIFVAEFKVVSSAPVDVRDTKGAPLDIKPNAVGSQPSYVQLFDKFESAFGNTKAFVLALLGKEEDSLEDNEFVDDLCELTDTEQAGGELTSKKGDRVDPARGMLIDYSTYRQVIKKGPNAGNQITLLKWAYVDQTAEEVAARRAELDV